VEVLEREDRFETAREAGESFAEVGEELLQDGVACRRERGRAPACDARFTASAFADNTAVAALQCPPAQIDDARRSLLRHLRGIPTDRTDDPRRPPPDPEIPVC
jgi:hypothetical protein